MGDYIFISTSPPHGLLVVGWQEAQDCTTAVTGTGSPLRNWNIDDFAMSYDSADQSGVLNPVPYVVDFTSQYVNPPTPRPFYCTRHVDSIPNPNPNQSSFFSVHNWYFFTMPENVTFASPSLPLNSLYVDQNWSW
jgi:hypothetical protein